MVHQRPLLPHAGHAGENGRGRRQEQRIRGIITAWDLPIVTEVRGKGLLLGIALDTSMIEVPEGKTAALVVVTKLMEKGLLVPPAGPSTFRLLPPLNVTDAEVDEALEIIREVLTSL